MERPISECPIGCRVKKVAGQPGSLGDPRIGTVHRETFADGVKSGVIWDNGHAVIGYPDDYLMEIQPDFRDPRKCSLCDAT